MLRVFLKGTDVESLKLGAAFLNASVMQVRQQVLAGEPLLVTEPFANEWDEWEERLRGLSPEHWRFFEGDHELEPEVWKNILAQTDEFRRPHES